MLNTLALYNYRSLRDVVVPLSRLNVVTGDNGSGKSNLYRGLRLLSQTAFGTATRSVAREGGLESVLWAGPESFSREVKQGRHPVQGQARRNEPVSLRLGFAGDDFSYAIDFGLPVSGETLFSKDPHIKRESIWQGEMWTERAAVIDRKGPMVRARDSRGSWKVIEKHLPTFDSALARLSDPESAPEVLMLRDQMRSWRFYDHFRTDGHSPARLPQVGSFTPALADDGHDLASAWQTIREIGDPEALNQAVQDAFPGARVGVTVSDGRFSLQFYQEGLLRPLSQQELSDGTLRYLLWIAALLTPRPPNLMILNEPETSLHPNLLPSLGRLMVDYSRHSQLWVISHAPDLIHTLWEDAECNDLQLRKAFAETTVKINALIETPPWEWPKR